jgi:hypothetical protein
MQKTVVVVSRFFFVGVLVAVLLALFLGISLSVAQNGSGERIVFKSQEQNKGVIAAGNGGISDDTGDIVADGVVAADARPLLIKRYLEKYKSPLVPYSDLIFKLSETYGFDYYWILAIGQQESNLCKKIPENSFNCWGYGIHKAGTLRFDSYELALTSFAEYLKREYFDKGYDTADKIMKKYCPSSNGSWAYGVNHFIDEIETGKF